MNPVLLARWQFTLTAIFHWLFVPLTLGLSIFIALAETQYVRTGDEKYKRMARFWGPILLLNFAMGVVTGIVQEFHFGLNWSEYSRFMGDIFGAPLAIEALLAFYLESTFLGVWFFGWDRLSKKVHLLTAWLVALGSNISAYWILTANSFMQHPTGYTLKGGRALMADFFALITNPNIPYQFTHVLTGGIALAGFVVMAFSAWHLLRKRDLEFFRLNFRWAARYALIGAILVGLIGHFQGQFVFRAQPLKMASAEALWETEQPASFVVFAIPNQQARTNLLAIRIPYMVSFLTYNSFTAKVEGINDLEKAAIARWGPGDYIPPVAINFYAFRIMVLAGLLMILLAILAVAYKQPEAKPGFLKVMVWAPILPYLAGVSGWIVAEVGRWPWIVYGLLRIEDAISPNVSAGNIVFSLVALTVLYAVLSILAFRLAIKYGAQEKAAEQVVEAY
jgi:cytochrome d ubiquinol oxidase subunit I